MLRRTLSPSLLSTTQLVALLTLLPLAHATPSPESPTSAPMGGAPDDSTPAQHLISMTQRCVGDVAGRLRDLGPNPRFADITRIQDDYWQAVEPEKRGEDGYNQYMRWVWLQRNRLMPDGTLPPAHLVEREWESYQATHAAKGKTGDQLHVASGAWRVIPVTAPPGRLNAIAFESPTSNKIYVGGVGGLWKALIDPAPNIPNSPWEPMTDNLTNPSVSSIVAWPPTATHPATIYIATGDVPLSRSGGVRDAKASSGLYRTTDDGQSWQKLAPPTPTTPMWIENIAGDVATRTILVATEQGLWT